MKALTISSKLLSFRLLLLVGIFSISTHLVGQSSRTIAYDAIKAAKEGTMIVCVETQTKSLEALNKVINSETSVKRKAELIEERQKKIEFTTVFEQSARAAFESSYSFGKYVIIPDTELKDYRDSLQLLEEPYLILVKRNDVRELGIVNSDNVHVPGPFPQYFDGFMRNLNKLFSEGNESQEVYTEYFTNSIFKLNSKLITLSQKLELKERKRELKRMQKGD